MINSECAKLSFVWLTKSSKMDGASAKYEMEGKVTIRCRRDILQGKRQHVTRFVDNTSKR